MPAIQLVRVGRRVAADHLHAFVPIECCASGERVHAEPHRDRRITRCSGHETVKCQQITHVRRAILVPAEDQDVARIIGK